MIRHFKPSVTVAAVIAKDFDGIQKFLLVEEETRDGLKLNNPAGHLDPGESLIQACARETLEETGWRPGPLTSLMSYFAHNGTSDTTFNVFLATSATYVGDPTDPDEAERIEWLSWDEVRAEIGAGRVRDGLSLTGLLYRLAGV